MEIVQVGGLEGRCSSCTADGRRESKGTFLASRHLYLVVVL